MVKVMMYGCNGYMGHVICNLIKDMENVTVAAGIDPCPGDQKDFPVFASLDECNVDVDVIIDFSAAVAVDGVLDYAAAKKIPLVECTTDLSEEQLAHLEEASKQSSNSSFCKYVTWRKYIIRDGKDCRKDSWRSRL